MNLPTRPSKNTNASSIEDRIRGKASRGPIVVAVLALSLAIGAMMPWPLAIGQVRSPAVNVPAGNSPDPILWFKLDEGSGTRITNASDTQQSGELLGESLPHWFDEGIAGSALTFDGGNQGYVLASDDRSIGHFEQLTLSLWVKSDAKTEGPLIAKWPESAFADGYMLSITKGRAQVDLLLDAADVTLVGETPVPQDGGWHHLSATYDGTIVRLFVDGEPDGFLVVSGSMDLDDTPLLLGRNPDGESFVGSIDDVRVYDSALTPVEVATLFAMDTDGDGIANVVELQRGLDPNNATEKVATSKMDRATAKAGLSIAPGLSQQISSSSALSIASVPNHQLTIDRSGINMRLTWRSTPGRSYGLQARDNLVSGSWITFGSLIAAGNTTFALNPPPLPANRFYRLSLPAFETTLYEPPQPTPGEPCNCAGSTAGPPELPYLYQFSGETHYSAADLWTKGRGLDFIWARKYRSRLGPNTAQGNGWDFSYNIRVRRLGQDVEVFDGNTRQDVFCRQADGTYVADQFFREGTFDGANVFTLKFPDTGTWTFRAIDGSPAGGKIDRITDRNGNMIQMTYDGTGKLTVVTDSLNRNISIGYNADGLISTVTDFAGRVVRYAYYQNGDAGGAFGDLKSVTSPIVTGTPNANDFPLGKTTTFTYSTGFADNPRNHNLLTVTDPLGQTWLRNEYSTVTDPANILYDRAVNVYWGGPTDRISFDYTTQVPAAANDFASIKVIVNDRVGNVSEFLYDAVNNCVNHRAFTGRAVPGQTTTATVNRPLNPLRPGDPSYFETHFQWNVDSRLTRIIYPSGNSIENTYELALNPNAPRRFRGNLRINRQLPGPLGGDQAEIVQQFEYENGGGCCGGENFITRQVDGRGNETLHSYDSRGNRLHTVHRIPSIVEDWEWNGFGQMTAHVLPDNGSSHRRRDEMTYYTTGPQNGYLHQQIMDAGGFNLTQNWEYNTVGVAIRHIDARGHDTLYSVNALDQRVRQTSREVTAGSGIRYQTDTFYDGDENVVRTDIQNIDDQGVLQANTHFATTFNYEILNHLIRTTQEVDPGHNIVTEYGHDSNRDRTLVRYGEAVNGNQPANTLTSLYDERRLPFREIRASGAAGAASQSTNQSDYDTNGNLNRTSQGLENAPRISLQTFDGYNRPTTSTDAMGNVTTVHYDANGNMLTQRVDGELNDVAGGAGNVRLSAVTNTYDAMDRHTRSDVAFFDTATQAPIGDGLATTQTFYSDNSQVVRVVDDNNHQTLTSYDGANRRRVVTDAKNNTATFNYDGNSNVVTTTELDKSDQAVALDQTFVTTNAYDNLDRLTQTVDNIGNTDRYTYDSRSDRRRFIDARNNLTFYTYDGVKRLIQSMRQMTATGDGSGAIIGTIVTSQTWDDDSRLTGQTDANSHTTAYVYDALSRMTQTIFADGTVNGSSYDIHDNPTVATDANANQVTTAFDLGNRPVTKTIVRGSGVVGVTAESYQYDGLSRIVLAQNNDSLVTRGYDSLSRVTRETQTVTSSGAPPRTVACLHDAVGNRLSCTYPGGRVISVGYDALDRKQTVSDPLGPIASYAYVGRAKGKLSVMPDQPDPPPLRVERRDYGNGTRTDYGYDDVRRMTGSEHKVILGGAIIDSRSYTWDATDNKTDMAVSPPSTVDGVRAFTYDSVNRLIQSETPFVGPTISYSLDGVGNRTHVTGGPAAGAYLLSSAVPPADFQVNQYTATPFDTRSYDPNGNLSVAGTRLFAYDYQNRLVSVFDFPTGSYQLIFSAKYDCFGRRIEKSTPDGIARYYYADAQEIEEQNGSNATLATYVWGVAIDDLLEMDRDGHQHFYHSDDQGTVRKVTDAAGTILEQYGYDDYGAPSFSDGNGMPLAGTQIGNFTLFTGRRYDPETGLYDYRTRYLDPVAGRFISRDTIGIWGDNIALGNGYTYVGNNPWSATDPNGMCSGPPWKWAACKVCEARCWVHYFGSSLLCGVQYGLETAGCGVGYGVRVAGCSVALAGRLVGIETAYQSAKFACFLRGQFGFRQKHWCSTLDTWREIRKAEANQAFSDCQNSAKQTFNQCTQRAAQNFNNCKGYATQNRIDCIIGCQ